MGFIFSIILVVITLVSVVTLLLNRLVMQKHLYVEACFDAVEKLVHERVELLLDFLPVDNNFNEICDAEAVDIITALPSLSYINNAALQENDEQLFAAIAAYNDSIIPYNVSIAQFPGKWLALLLDIHKKERIEYDNNQY